MNDKKCIIKILKMFYLYKTKLIIIMSCMIASSVISVIIPIISQNVMDLGFMKKDISTVVRLSLILLFLYFVNIFVDIVKEKNRLLMSAQFTEQLNKDFFQHIMNIKSSYLESKNSSEILAQAEMDVSAIASLSDGKIFYAVTKLLGIVGGFVGLCILSVELAVVVVLFIPVKYIVIAKLTRKRKDKYDKYMQINTKYSSWLGETISSIIEIRNFGIKKEKENELMSFQKEINNADYELNMLGEYNGSADNLLVNILQIMIYIIGIFFIVKKGMTVGSIFAFSTYSTYITDPVISLLNIKFLLSGILPSAKRYFEFREQEEEEDRGEAAPDKNQYELIFEKVDFYYGSKKIFNNLSFNIKTGEKVAVIGGNGVGKSTLIKLITRTYVPQGGIIMVNRIPIEDYDLVRYRKVYSVVNQSFYLFNDSIKNNVELYCKQNKKKLKEALLNSGLSEFSDEKNMEYIVGDNGAKLSGGAKAKSCISKSFL